MISRRLFFITTLAGGTYLANFAASAQTKLEDNDPQAIALGYVSDSAKADKKKYQNHSVGQRCNGCQLFSGKPTDSNAACAVFSGKYVVGIGWCSAYAMKPT